VLPEGTALFFPVVNSVSINTPAICGQSGALSVRELRELSANFISTTTNVVAEVDGRRVNRLQHLRSTVFAVAMPAHNIFDAPCASLGGVPRGVSAPAVDDGLYVALTPLAVGRHSIHIHAESLDPVEPANNFMQDVTYTIRVVAASRP
jgi:hypothetical protein